MGKTKSTNVSAGVSRSSMPPIDGKINPPIKKPLMAAGFLNKNVAGKLTTTVAAIPPPPPATNASGEVVCSISSNPRLNLKNAEASYAKVVSGDASPVKKGNTLADINSDPKLGFIASSDVVDNTVDPLNTKKGWVSLFGANRLENKGFRLSENLVGVTNTGIVLDIDDVELDSKSFFRLVGYFTPRFPGLDALGQLVRKWDCKCKSYQHPSNWTVFTFDTEADMLKVLEGGPYFIFGKSLYLKKMPDLFDFDWGGHTILPAWVQLPGLSLCLWNEKALGKICSFIGKPLYSDAATKEKSRLGFARVLVEIDVSVVLPTEMPITVPGKPARTQKIFYEDVPKFCQSCKKMGHRTDTCASDKFAIPKLYVKKTLKAPVNNVQKPVASKAPKQKNVANTTEWVVQGKKGDSTVQTQAEAERKKVSDKGKEKVVMPEEDENEDEEDDDENDEDDSDDGSDEQEMDLDTLVPTEEEFDGFYRAMDGMDGEPSVCDEDDSTVIALAAHEELFIKEKSKGQKKTKPKTVADALVQMRIDSKKKEDEWKQKEKEKEATLTRSRARNAKTG